MLKQENPIYKVKKEDEKLKHKLKICLKSICRKLLKNPEKQIQRQPLFLRCLNKIKISAAPNI